MGLFKSRDHKLMQKTSDAYFRSFATLWNLSTSQGGTSDADFYRCHRGALRRAAKDMSDRYRITGIAEHMDEALLLGICSKYGYDYSAVMRHAR